MLLALSAGCAKPCQPKASQPYSHLTDTPWRLVESNSLETFYKNPTKYSFVILTFNMDAKGDLKQVTNNDQQDNPIRVVTWNVNTTDGRSGSMRIKYEVPPPASSDPNAPAPTPDPSQTTTTDYTYQLDSELNMTDSGGHHLRFVPFTGVVSPDDICTF